MPKLAATLVVTLAPVLPVLAPAAVRAADFDGTWSVELVTESGFCDARYSHTLSVQDGRVRPVSTAAGGATVTGRVGTDGSVGLNVATAAASGTASGRLQTQGGAGTWRVGGLCSGRWSARRHGMRTAQAE